MIATTDSSVRVETGDLPRDAAVLLAKVREHWPGASVAPLADAYRFASRAHEGQVRASGEPYVNHSLTVATILAGLRLDPETIVAALLHDVPEDTGVQLEEIRQRFGAEVAALVDGATKLGKIHWRTREERQAENLRKMFLAMASDIRIVLIKLADRLHNMRTIEYLPEDKQHRIAQETLEIYAPLSERLGIGQIQWELEDLAFEVLEPDTYQEISTGLAKASEERAQVVQEVVEILHRELREAGIAAEQADIAGRPKHVYSIWKKLQRPKYAGQGLARIYDRLGVRLIVQDVKDCYAALGVVHSLWKPIPGEFDDYIANPKTSGYQSLHTAVLYTGEPLEVQIRTRRMHYEAEHGIAAHWRYKEGKASDKAFDQKLAWMRQLLEWHQEMQDARQFMQSVKLDLFQNEVFVFTPKGDVIDLPAGATPIDFAYRVHTEVGHRCTGAKVNGRLVPLSHKLSSGDIVEIVTSKTPGPSRDWLAFAVTTNAKSKIKQWFKQQRREENVQRGREVLEKELRRLGGGIVQALKPERLREAAKQFNLGSEDDLFAALGNGDLSLLTVAQALRGVPAEEAAQEEPALPAGAPAEAARTARGVRVRGADNLLIHFSRCCNPLPGDRVVGYITRGRGVTIHRLDCPNMSYIRAHPERLIEVEWERMGDGSYPVAIEVEAFDRVGLLKDILATVAETRLNALSVNAKVRKDKTAVIHLLLDIKNVDQLHSVMQKVRKLPEVLNVERVVPS